MLSELLVEVKSANTVLLNNLWHPSCKNLTIQLYKLDS